MNRIFVNVFMVIVIIFLLPTIVVAEIVPLTLTVDPVKQEIMVPIVDSYIDFDVTMSENKNTPYTRIKNIRADGLPTGMEIPDPSPYEKDLRPETSPRTDNWKFKVTSGINPGIYELTLIVDYEWWPGDDPRGSGIDKSANVPVTLVVHSTDATITGIHDNTKIPRDNVLRILSYPPTKLQDPKTLIIDIPENGKNIGSFDISIMVKSVDISIIDIYVDWHDTPFGENIYFRQSNPRGIDYDHGNCPATIDGGKTETCKLNFEISNDANNDAKPGVYTFDIVVVYNEPFIVGPTYLLVDPVLFLHSSNSEQEQSPEKEKCGASCHVKKVTVRGSGLDILGFVVLSICLIIISIYTMKRWR